MYQTILVWSHQIGRKFNISNEALYDIISSGLLSDMNIFYLVEVLVLIILPEPKMPPKKKKRSYNTKSSPGTTKPSPSNINTMLSELDDDNPKPKSSSNISSKKSPNISSLEQIADEQVASSADTSSSGVAPPSGASNYKPKRKINSESSDESRGDPKCK